jgi:hypothetical protein
MLVAECVGVGVGMAPFFASRFGPGDVKELDSQVIALQHRAVGRNRRNMTASLELESEHILILGDGVLYIRHAHRGVIVPDVKHHRFVSLSKSIFKSSHILMAVARPAP